MNKLLRGDPRDITEALDRLRIRYIYDAGDYYISDKDYHDNKNQLAYYGVI